MNSMNAFIFLRKHWIVTLGKLSVIVLVGGILLSITVGYFNLFEASLGVAIAISLSVTMEFISWWFLYHTIRCPICGHNLSRFKNGNKMAIHHVYSALTKGSACRCCGWQPPEIKKES